MKKLRVLKHTGTITEYIREYNSLMLEIPDMPERSRLLFFMDGLQRWAEQELKRRGVQDLASAIAAAESLVEFSKEPPKKARSKAKEKECGSSDSEQEEDEHLKDLPKSGQILEAMPNHVTSFQSKLYFQIEESLLKAILKFPSMSSHL